MGESMMPKRVSIGRQGRPQRRSRIRTALLLLPMLSTLTLGIVACKDDTQTARNDLVQRLNDGRDHVRIEAAAELGVNANRLESAELARAARGASIPVRRAIAAALGQAKASEAVDYLGTFTRDPDDSVRAAAVLALSGRQEAKARAYVLSAYSSSGPETRATVASLGTDVLTAAVVDEARTRIDRHARPRSTDGCCPWLGDNAEGCGTCSPQVRADALKQLGLHGTEQATAELALRLVDPSQLIAAASAEGLGLARATEYTQELIDAVRSGRPDVAVAAGLALARMGADSASEALATPLPNTPPLHASHLLDALELLPLSDAARDPLCETARSHPSPQIAVRAFLLVSDSCVLEAGPVPTGEDDRVRARMEVLAFAKVRDDAWLARARELLDNGDARLAATAAHYLGANGTKKDGERLLELAEEERSALVRARIAENRRRNERRIPKNPALANLEQLSEVFPDVKESLQKQKPNALQELIRERTRVSDDQPFEHRPGALGLVRSAAVGAALLGADASELGARLLDDEEEAFRQTAVIVADLLGPEGDSLRAALTGDEDRSLRISMAAADLASGRAGARERLTALLEREDDPAERIRIVEALAPVASEAKDALLAATARNDAASPLALRLLAGIDAPLDPRLVTIAQKHLDYGTGFGAAESLLVLDRLEGSEADQALARATVHPRGDVRERALSLLTKRGVCTPTAAALEHDFERRVREAAKRARTVCADEKADEARSGSSN